jgi:hypothetical protein
MARILSPTRYDLERMLDDAAVTCSSVTRLARYVVQHGDLPAFAYYIDAGTDGVRDLFGPYHTIHNAVRAARALDELLATYTTL